MSSPEHPALDTLRAFIDANQRQDSAGMRACLSRSTLEAGGFSAPMPPGFRFQAAPAEPDPRGVAVPLDVFPPGTSDTPAMSMRCVMVEEQGCWKLDLLATMEPQLHVMEAALREAVKRVGMTMNDVLAETGDAFVAALGGTEPDAAGRDSQRLEPRAETDRRSGEPAPDGPER